MTMGDLPAFTKEIVAAALPGARSRAAFLEAMTDVESKTGKLIRRAACGQIDTGGYERVSREMSGLIERFVGSHYTDPVERSRVVVDLVKEAMDKAENAISPLLSNPETVNIYRQARSALETLQSGGEIRLSATERLEAETAANRFGR